MPKTQARFQLVPERTVGTIWGVKMYYTKVQPEGNLRERRPVTDIENVRVYGRIYSQRWSTRREVSSWALGHRRKQRIPRVCFGRLGKEELP